MTIYCTKCGIPMEEEKPTTLFCPLCIKITNFIEFESVEVTKPEKASI